MLKVNNGLPDSVTHWINQCKKLKSNKEKRELIRNECLERISIRFYIKQIFLDWQRTSRCKRIKNRFNLISSLSHWIKQYKFRIKANIIIYAYCAVQKKKLFLGFQSWIKKIKDLKIIFE